MRQAQSYYEILGVTRTATRQEIRAAYVRLMKRHHPDVATRGVGSADLLPLINRCYAVLRDPMKRSQHDAKLFASSALPITPPRLRHVTRPRGKGALVHVAILVGAVAFALSWVAVNLVGERITQQIAATAAGWMPRPPLDTKSTPLALPRPAVAQRMADLARTVSTRDAERISRECFARANRESSAGLGDSCLLFDTAFLYWRKTPVPTSTFPAYFADQVVNDRHRAMTIGSGASADQRLIDLREMAFQALIRGLRAPLPEQTSSAPVGDSMMTSPELRKGEQERLAAVGVP